MDNITLATKRLSETDIPIDVYKQLCVEYAKRNCSNDPNYKQYEDVWPLTFIQRSQPCGPFLLSEDVRNEWIDSGKEFGAVFAQIVDKLHQVYQISLLGFTNRSEDKIFIQSNKIEAECTKLIGIDIIMDGDQYIFNADSMTRLITVPKVIHKHNARQEPICADFVEFCVLKDGLDIMNEMKHVDQRLHIEPGGGIIEIITNRLKLYKIMLQLHSTNNASLLNSLNRYARDYKLGIRPPQCYQIFIECIVASYNPSFAKFLIHCEKNIAHLVCCSPECNGKCNKHSDSIESNIEWLKSIKETLESDESLMTTKTLLQRTIQEHFGDISQVYETYIERKKREYIFV